MLEPSLGHFDLAELAFVAGQIVVEIATLGCASTAVSKITRAASMQSARRVR